MAISRLPNPLQAFKTHPDFEAVFGRAAASLRVRKPIKDGNAAAAAAAAGNPAPAEASLETDLLSMMRTTTGAVDPTLAMNSPLCAVVGTQTQVGAGRPRRILLRCHREYLAAAATLHPASIATTIVACAACIHRGLPQRHLRCPDVAPSGQLARRK